MKLIISSFENGNIWNIIKRKIHKIITSLFIHRKKNPGILSNKQMKKIYNTFNDLKSTFNAVISKHVPENVGQK